MTYSMNLIQNSENFRQTTCFIIAIHKRIHHFHYRGFQCDLHNDIYRLFDNTSLHMYSKINSRYKLNTYSICTTTYIHKIVATSIICGQDK